MAVVRIDGNDFWGNGDFWGPGSSAPAGNSATLGALYNNLFSPGGPSATSPFSQLPLNPLAGLDPRSLVTGGTSPDGTAVPSFDPLSGITGALPIQRDPYLDILGMRPVSPPSTPWPTAGATTRPDTPGGGRPGADTAPSRPPSGIPSPGTAAGGGTTGGTTGGTPGASVLQGLAPTAGATATINGVSYTATPTGWAPSASLPPTNTGASSGTSSLLGFTPNYQTFNMPTFATDGSGAMTGQRPAAQTYQYLDRASAERLAQMLGATVYGEDSTAPNRTAPQELSLVFGNGARLNAGLVARMFETDPGGAMRRLQAELNYSPGNAVASTSPAYAAPYTPPSPQALNAGQNALGAAPKINGGEAGTIPQPQAWFQGSTHLGSTNTGGPNTSRVNNPFAPPQNPLNGPDFNSFSQAQANARPPALGPSRNTRNGYYPGYY